MLGNELLSSLSLLFGFDGDGEAGLQGRVRAIRLRSLVLILMLMLWVVIQAVGCFSLFASKALRLLNAAAFVSGSQSPIEGLRYVLALRW